MYFRGLNRDKGPVLTRPVFGNALKQGVLALFFGAFSLVFCQAAFAQTSSYGKPVGFVRIEVPANSQRLSSIPFTPFNSSLNALLDKQLTGESQASTADRIIKWDSSQQGYLSSFKAENTGNSELNGKWFVDDTSWVPSALTLLPGDAFFVQNQHSTAQNVFLMGKLVLDQNKSIALSPEMNLFAYPFSSKISLNSSDLKNDGAHGDTAQTGSPDIVSSVNPDLSYWLLDNSSDPNDGKWLDSSDQLATVSLSLSKGYWYRRQATSSLTWSEVRPYQNPFDVTASAPLVTGMSINSSLNEISLTISCTGATGETLEIFYKDLAADDLLTTESGWLLAAVGISTNSNTSVTWTDSGESNPVSPVLSRTAVTSPFMRVYLVSRQDIDSDGDGISDGREQFFYGSNPNSSDSDGDGLTDYEELFTYSTNPNSKDSDNDGFDDYLEVVLYGTDPNSNASVPSDSEAPSAPSNLIKSAVSLSVVSLSWTASTDNIAVAGYRIYRNGFEVGSTKESAYVDSNLLPDTQYVYTVKAYDHMNNLSQASGSLNVTTGYSGATCCYVDDENGDDDNSGSSPSTAKKTIQAAIDSSTDNTVIVVADGIYIENLALDSRTLIIVSKSGASKTEIWGAYTGRTVSLCNTTPASILEGFIVSGGYTVSGNGGGILIDSGSPVIANCVITDNEAANGGGIAVSGTSARPVIINCVIKENSANSKGGGIFYSQGKPRISASLINANSAQSDGGGIYGED